MVFDLNLCVAMQLVHCQLFLGKAYLDLLLTAACYLIIVV